MDDAAVISALAAAANKEESYIANVLATEALNRLRRATTITENLGEGVFSVDLDGRITFMNAAAERLLGYPKGEAIGEPAHDLIQCACTGRSSASFTCPLWQTIDTGEAATCPSDRFSRHDGSTIPVAYLTSPILRDGMVDGAVIVFRDISERLSREARRASRHAARHAVADTLATAPGLREAAPRILQAMGTHLGWDVGCLYTVDHTSDSLHCVSVWQSPGVNADRFEAETRRRTFSRGEGLPGRVWLTAEPLWIEDVQREALFLRQPEAEADFLRGAFAFPILHGDDVLGVVEFFGRGVRRPDTDLLETTNGIGCNIGAFLKRMEHERALAEAKALLEATLEATTDGVAVTDPGGRFVRWNRQFIDLWRIPEEALAPGNDARALDLVLRQVVDPDGFLDILRNLTGRPEATSFDVIPLRDGRVLERYSRPQWLDRRVVGRVWSFRDVTPRHRAEREREAHEALLAGVLDTITDGVVYHDRTGVITLVNRAACIIADRHRDEILGRRFDDPLWDVLEVDGVPYTRNHHRFRSALEEGKSLRNVEVTARRGDGRPVTLLMNFVPLRDEEGAHLGIVGTFTDITLLRRRERELAASEARFRRLAEATTEGVLIHDQGTIREVNRAACEMLGYEREELLGLDCRQFCAESFRPIVTQAIREGREDPYRGSLVRKDGRLLPVEVRGRNLRDGDEVLRVVVVRPLP